MDNLRGILIFLVVFSHFLLFYVDQGVTSVFVHALTYYIYSFHMPLFIFICGYFSKDVEKSRRKAFERLLLPYLLFNSLMMFCEAHATDNGSNLSLLTPVYVHWFLLALFFWRILLKDLVRIRLVLPISVFVALYIGCFGEVTNVLALGRTIAFLPFFLLGYYTTDDMITRVRSTNKLLALVVLVVIAWPIYLLTTSGYFSLPVFLAFPCPLQPGLRVRLAFFTFAVLIGIALLILCPARQLKFLTAAGERSLLIFLLHRYVTFVFYEMVPAEDWRSFDVLVAFGLSLLTVWFLGSAVLARAYAATFDLILTLITRGRKVHGSPGTTARALIAPFSILALPVLYVVLCSGPKAPEEYADVIHAVLDRDLQRELSSAVTISFVGDLILLEDQVKQAWNPETERFDFSPVFEYTSKYLQQADYSIGVLEVPVAGEALGYSTGNFGDGIPLYLNAPDQWPRDIKNCGIDLVTTATNHALDKGEPGLYRTLDILDQIGLQHVGTCRDTAERKRVVLEDVKGVKIAFLAYSYGTNGYDNRYFDQDKAYLLGILSSPDDKRYFRQSLEMLRQDIRRVKQHNPDVIIALPHMGTQFSHESDEFSRTWAERMLQEGVDIVFADHSHAVQPIEYHKRDAGFGEPEYGLIVFCPGNFVNGYTREDGDAAAIVNIHLSTAGERKGHLLGASIVPMWIQRPIDRQSRPVPVYEAVTNSALRSELSGLEWNRIEEVHGIVTEVMLGTPLSIDQVQDRYFYLPERGYVRERVRIELSKQIVADELDKQRRELLEVLSISKRTLLLGDSITAGSKNGGYGWFEPLVSLFQNNHFINRSAGGETTKLLLAHLDQDIEEEADLFIVALGANDVRYRDKAICAMNPNEFVHNIERIAQRISSTHPDARIVFVNAWLAFDNDLFSRLSARERDVMIENYNRALEEFCSAHNHIFIGANKYIRAFLDRHVTDEYILDHIHPNANKGIKLYCNAVLFGAPGNWAFR